MRFVLRTNRRAIAVMAKNDMVKKILNAARVQVEVYPDGLHGDAIVDRPICRPIHS